jgi:uncharacterized RDD family membrane protein YckC
MKCPKCGYLGFETTDRCRHCGYDFSLFPFTSEPDLTLQDSPTRTPAVLSDFELPSIAPQPEASAPAALDLDRLFGAESAPAAAEPPPVREAAPESASSTPTAEMASFEAGNGHGEPGPSLFEEMPIVTAPRPPLAVRRSTPDLPRGRARTTRPARAEEPLSLGLEATERRRSHPDVSAAEQLEAATIGARLGAAGIDGLLLGGIAALALILTVRIAGLELTMADLRVIPPVPFAAFIVVLALAYFAGFTVAGGQTIGKMATKIRVLGDDGRSVDVAGSVLRALGAMLVPLTLGLAYVTVLLTSDHRALHDRLAGTRVVRA